MLVVGARGDVRDYDQVLDTVGKEMGKVKILRPERQGTETLRLKGSSLTRMGGNGTSFLTATHIFANLAEKSPPL
jgi:hypothetical protein